MRSATHLRGSTLNWWLSGLRRTGCTNRPPVVQAHATNRLVQVASARITWKRGKRPGSLASTSLAQSLLRLPKGLDVGCVNDHGQEQPGNIHNDVVPAFRHPLARVIAARPLFLVSLATGCR